jgi:uncharacterized protein with PIN domain
MPLPKYKKQFWLVISIGIVVILLAGGGLSVYLVRYSATNDRVCAQCHPELIDPWKESKGHPADTTSCHECHSPGQKILPSDWNIVRHIRNQIAPPEYLADDILTSQRCLDCHADILDLGYEVKKKVIKFTHRYHIDEGLECVDCHRTAGHAYMIGSTNRPSIDECRDCHIMEFTGPPKSQKCLSCHEVILTPGKTLQ